MFAEVVEGSGDESRVLSDAGPSAEIGALGA